MSYLFLIIYFVFTFILLNFLYQKVKIYYRPLTYKDKETGKIVDVHKLYEPFQAKDHLSYWKMMIQGLFLFPIKFTILVLIIILFMIHLKIFSIFYTKQNTDKSQYQKLSRIMKFYNYLFLLFSFIKPIEKKVDCTEVYKKYLGPDYDFSQQKYSAITCNHTGYYDVILNMYLHACGFIAKIEISRYLFIGNISKSINCLFVNRQNQSSRDEIFDKLYERQNLYMEGKFFSPLCLFPEGTTTSGRNILKFKKGAFYHLLPIKPELIYIDQNSEYHITCGAQNLLWNTLTFLCYFGTKMYYTFLPVIKPTEYMFKNFAHFGKEKWEIYSEVVRKIYCEIGGFTESDLGFRDSKDYSEAMIKGEFDYENILKKNN